METQYTGVYEQRESDEVTDEKGKEATTSTEPLPRGSSDTGDRESVEFLRGHPIIRNGFDVSKFLISDRDDGDPAFTFRCFVLGTVFTALAGVITMLYVFKPVEISISVIFIQILVFLCGEAWARFTPQPERLPWSWLQALARFLNFGQPFRIKEHVVASLIASSGNNGLSGVEIYAVERLFYNRDVGATTAVLATFSISLIGFLLAGVLRPIVVYPAELVYWGQLPQVALFQSLHHDREVNRKRLIKFGWALLLSGVWQLFPAYVFTWLGGVSIFCVASSSAAPEIRKVFGTLFGGASSNEGVGILNFGLDWQYITSSYLSFPLKQQLNSWIGIGLFYAIMPALYYGNAFGSKAIGLPFMSTTLYNDTGGRYPVTTMLSLKSGEPLIDEAKLNELGNPRLTSSAVWGFFTQNLAIGGLIAHVIVFWRKDLIRAWRQAKDRTQPDPHYQAIITRYKEVPSLWYWILFALCFVAGLIVNIKGETTLPWWGYIVALLLGAFIAPFSCFLYGLYGNGIGTNQLSKMIGGAIHPHRPLANLYFASWSHQVILLCVNLAGWLKLGQYTKIPPRVMFFTQIYASLLGAAINYVVMTVVVTNKREILIDPAGNNIWSGAYLQSLNTQAITWSIASKVYGVSGRYFIVPLGLVIGLTLPVLHWVFTKCFPRTARWEINTAIIAEYAGMNYYGNTSFISSSIAVGVFSQVYLRKRLPEIFAKYNYLIGAGLDGGSQVVIFILSFAVYGASGKARPFPSWWGAPAEGNPDHCVS